MPEDVKKIVLRYGKVRTRCVLGSRMSVILTAVMPVGVVTLTLGVTFIGVRRLVVDKQAAIPETPQSALAVGIDERASRRICNQDGAWADRCDGLGPFVLRYGWVKR